jgi:hypothetical protein
MFEAAVEKLPYALPFEYVQVPAHLKYDDLTKMVGNGVSESNFFCRFIQSKQIMMTYVYWETSLFKGCFLVEKTLLAISNSVSYYKFCIVFCLIFTKGYCNKKLWLNAHSLMSSIFLGRWVFVRDITISKRQHSRRVLKFIQNMKFKKIFDHAIVIQECLCVYIKRLGCWCVFFLIY